jgi:hypothetical protein
MFEFKGALNYCNILNLENCTEYIINNDKDTILLLVNSDQQA